MYTPWAVSILCPNVRCYARPKDSDAHKHGTSTVVGPEPELSLGPPWRTARGRQPEPWPEPSRRAPPRQVLPVVEEKCVDRPGLCSCCRHVTRGRGHVAPLRVVDAACLHGCDRRPARVARRDASE
eukprot:scaffold7390_cov420-Prasinococcus_capsulatus_cf.AAC.9